MAKKANNFEFKVIGIEDFGFIVDEFIDVEEDNVVVGFRLDVFSNIQDDWLGLIVQIIFEAEESEKGIPDNERKIFMSSKVATRFEVENLEKYISDEGNINFPKGKFETMFDIAVTHTRAILAKNSAGSSYSNYIVPIINPTKLLPELVDYNKS